MHPDLQAQLIISFQEEKRREAEAQRNQGWQDDSTSWQARLLSAGGDALISAGNLLKRHADLGDTTQPATTSA
jgi:hypothetical protein